MSIKDRKEKIDNFMLDHSKIRIVYEWVIDLILSIFSAFVFAFGFRSFIAPVGALKLASGGASGVSQIIIKVVELIRGAELGADASNTIISIAYFVINIPIIIIAFACIGKRFAILTVVNIVFVSIFNAFIPQSLIEVFVLDATDYLARALFAGLCTGVSSGLAFRIGASSGGMDVISYYFATKRSSSIGKLVFTINGAIIVIFTILSYIQNPGSAVILLYTLVYTFTAALVIDRIEKSRKKLQIQIVSQKEDLHSLLVSAFPHGCTVINAQGGYSGEPVKMIIFDVSYDECSKVIKLARSLDEKVFINVMPINEVHGKFYIKPVR